METILETKALTKTFPGVRALHSVDFELRRGEVHVLLGENGAGKSTLIKILTGVHEGDSGEIFVEEQRVSISTPYEAFQYGIAAIYQELTLIPHLDVASNIFLGRLPASWGGVIDRKMLYAEAEKVLKIMKSDLDPQVRVLDLGFGKRQLVEIAKALSSNARIIFMDEPTSALDNDEREHLFGVIRDLKAKGFGIIYISHKLEEVAKIGDRVTVLRDGERVVTANVSDISLEELIRHMVGREVSNFFHKKKVDVGDNVVEVRGLNRSDVLHDISFTVRKGEILGIAGLVGAGRTEMAKCLFGIDRYDSGEILVDRNAVLVRSPQEAIAHGIALLTEDRKASGLIMPLPVKTNISLPLINSQQKNNCTRMGVLDRSEQNRIAADYMQKLRIKAQSIHQAVGNLSGGNQQKVILAKWLALRPKLIIFDEPTRGIDIGAKNEIYQLMEVLLREGIAIIMISSEMPELLALSDRILVFSEGRISGEFARSEATQEKIMACAVKHFETGADTRVQSGENA